MPVDREYDAPPKYRAISDKVRKAVGPGASAVVFVDDRMLVVLPRQLQPGTLIDGDDVIVKASLSALLHHEDNQDLWLLMMHRIATPLDAGKQPN